jgi:exopolyphosphatase/guanosine-5'-triphosphate,3'-diphosphate pyrophosphatase
MTPASIDIGSHSSILLVQGISAVQKIEVCRLGEDLASSGQVSQANLQKLFQILSQFRATAHALGAEIKAAAMTEAVRKASNQDEVLAVAEKALWMRPQVLSGEEEARLTYKAIASVYGEGNTAIDIGGGSTEFSNGKEFVSVPVGALMLFKKMKAAVPGPEYKAWIKETFKELDLKKFAKRPLIFVGGTATALAQLLRKDPVFDAAQIEGMSITPEELTGEISRLSDLSPELRSALPGLEQGRGEVIICGLFWMRSLVEKFKVESFRVSTMGLRHGLLL